MYGIFQKLASNIWVLIGIIVFTFLLHFLVVSLGVFWPFEGVSLFRYPLEDAPNMIFWIYVIFFRILFYFSFIPLITFLIDIIRKKSRGMIFAGIYFLLLNFMLLFFQVQFQDASLIGRILTGLNLLIGTFFLVLVFIRNMNLKDSLENIQDYREVREDTITFDQSSSSRKMIIINVISMLIFLSLFFFPLYSIRGLDGNEHIILISALFSTDANLVAVIGFFILLIILFFSIMMLTNILTNYAKGDEQFFNLSNKFTKFIFICLSGFFIIGLFIRVFYSFFDNQDILITSYIPLFIMLIIYFKNAILFGKIKVHHLDEVQNLENKPLSVEPLVFLVFLTMVTLSLLFLPIIKISVDSMSYTDVVSMTGLDLLRDYETLGEGYRMLAFFVLVKLLIVGFGLIVAIAAYLSKSSMFNQIIKSATFANVFFVFLVAISGYYFRIAQGINFEMLQDLIDHYNTGFVIDTNQYDYVIETDATYSLMVSVGILLVMFSRRVFEHENMPSLGNPYSALSASSTVKNDNADVTPETSDSEFDPSYALTEIDLMKDKYKADLSRRKKLKPTDASLKGLTDYIVNYAKNSRLHLSYSKQSIADFIAGLGASKLSILQGMSGTGKTSLPKIFAEAIMGNCDVIEVESSWKDKHELLGYYNEFSRKYTPKNFTLSLYKANFNRDIVTFILLDEMNLSRIEYYFSDFLSLMEHEERNRKIKLINYHLRRQENGENIDYEALENGHTLSVPPNVWFIGTANRDESTFVISDKVYDRATTMNFMNRAPKVRNFSEPIDNQFYDYKTFNKLLENAKAKTNFDAEENETIKAVEKLLAPYNISFGNRILKQIEDFVNIYTECLEGEDVNEEAIETILLSKVVSKLELKIIEDKEQLVMEFDKLNLSKCADFVRSLEDE